MKSWETLYIYCLVAAVLTVSMIINIHKWWGLLESISLHYTLYYCYIKGLSPGYFMHIYAICGLIGLQPFVYLCFALVIVSFLYIITKTYPKVGIYAIAFVFLPSIIMFIMDPYIVPTVIMLLSIVALMDNKIDSATFLLGIAIMMNWAFFLLIPPYLIASKSKIRAIVLISVPNILALWYIYYYTYSIGITFIISGIGNYSLPVLKEALASTFNSIFGSPILLFFIVVAGAIGALLGWYIANFIGDPEERVMILLLIQLLELEAIMPHTLVLMLSLPIHIAFLLVLFNTRLNTSAILVVDGIYSVSLYIGDIEGILMYKAMIVLIVAWIVLMLVSQEKMFLEKITPDLNYREILGFIGSIRNLLARLFSRRIVKLILLYLATLLLLFYKIGEPPEKVFDEWHYVTAAEEILKEGTDPRFEHPPLVKYLIAIGIMLLGDNSLGWRILIVPFSALVVPAVYYMAQQITGSEKVSMIATLLLLTDPLYFSLSRLAMLDGPSLGFASLGMASATKYSSTKGEKTRWLYITGLFLGLAISSKMVALMAILVVLTFVPFPKGKHDILKMIFALLIIPTIVLCITYVPLYIMAIWKLEQQGLILDAYTKFLLAILFPLWVMEIVGIMFGVYSRLPDTQPTIESHPWDWIYGWKPIRCYTKVIYVFQLGTYIATMVILLAEPVTWFLGLLLILTLGVVYASVIIVLYSYGISVEKILHKKSRILDDLKAIKKSLDPYSLIFLWGFLTWLALIPSALAHWFYYYYNEGSNVVMDMVSHIVYRLFKEGRLHYIFYVYHLLPSMYIMLAIALDKADKKLAAPLSMLLLIMAAMYFLSMYPIISGAIWMDYWSIRGKPLG